MGNVVATANPNGLDDGLAIELARSLGEVAVPLHQ